MFYWSSIYRFNTNYSLGETAIYLFNFQFLWLLYFSFIQGSPDPGNQSISFCWSPDNTGLGQRPEGTDKTHPYRMNIKMISGQVMSDMTENSLTPLKGVQTLPSHSQSLQCC